MKERIAWPEIVEHVRAKTNNVMRIDLVLLRGTNVCRFSSFEEILAEGQSQHSMQEAVELCFHDWGSRRSRR